MGCIWGVGCEEVVQISFCGSEGRGRTDVGFCVCVSLNDGIEVSRASRGRHFWDCAVAVNEVEVENVATSRAFELELRHLELAS